MNKAIIVGNLTRDPEQRFLPSGDAIANFAVATSEVWKDKNTGEQKEQSEFHRCSAFGKLAEVIAKYLHKGSKVYIEGSLRTRKWQAQDGSDRYSTEIRVSEMQMLDSRQDGQAQPARQAAQQAQPATTAAAPDDFDDSDIPF